MILIELVDIYGYCVKLKDVKKIKNAHHLKVTGIVLSVKGHKTVKKNIKKSLKQLKKAIVHKSWLIIIQRLVLIYR